MKKPKDEVDYSKGMAKTHCGNCRFFEKVEPNTCTKVLGVIKSDMWCKLWKAIK